MKQTLYFLLISLLAVTPLRLAAAAAETKTEAKPGTAAKTAENKAAPGKSAAKDAKETSKQNDKAAPKKAEEDPKQKEEKKAQWIEQTLDYGIQEERLTAVNGIQQIKDPAIRARLVKKLLDVVKDEEEPELLVKTITVLGEMKETSAIPIMTAKLDHRSEDVCVAAIYALKKTKAMTAKEKLIQKLKSRDLGKNSNLTSALIQTLGEFKAVETVPFARESIESPKTNMAIKEELVIFLGKAQSQDSKGVLLKIFKDEDENVTLRAFAVNSLAKIGAKDAAPDIKDVIKTIDSYELKKRKKYYTLYLYSIAALATLGDPDAIPKLINALRHNSSQVRLKAISLIKDFKDKRTIDILKYKMKNDQSAKVQSAARKALKEMGVDVGEDPNEAKKDVKKDAAKTDDKKRNDTNKKK
ncbi:MAG: HEAT repeat domain-containing protein [Spirochaetes bacterium]|nr:HEAT repeat domain-containing protein [Spirochaetota bacterium]